MNRLFTAIIVLAAVAGADAAERTIEQKRAAAAAVLGLDAQPARSAASGCIEPLYAARNLTVMGVRGGGGFAVVANDDGSAAVLGYSREGFSGAMPCGLRWWLEATDAALERGVVGDVDADGLVQGGRVAPKVGPLLTSKWAQGEPFNGLCPALESGGHCVAGCVPVAMAQVMRYHRWPVRGTGTHEYLLGTMPDGSEKWLSADFGSTVYAWDDMLDSYAPGAFSEAQAAAVAELVYHCGVGAEAGFGGEGTSANVTDGGYAMLTYLGYNPDMAYLERSEHEEDWMEMLIGEIDAGRPVIYDGRKLNGGDFITADRHAFVIDGYGDDGLFHVNWGWGGMADGMYRLDYLKPDEDEGYNYDQYMLLGIAPAGVDVPRRYLFSNRRITIGINGIYGFLYGGIAQVVNCSCRPLYGRLSLVAEGNGWFGELFSTDVSGIRPLAGFQLRNGQFDLPASMPDGDYRIYAAFYDELHGEWVRVDYAPNSTDEYVVTKEGTTFTRYEGICTSAGSAVAGGMAPDGEARVYDMSGRLVMSAPAEGFSADDIPGRGTFIVSCGGTVRKVAKP